MINIFSHQNLSIFSPEMLNNTGSLEINLEYWTGIILEDWNAGILKKILSSCFPGTKLYLVPKYN